MLKKTFFIIFSLTTTNLFANYSKPIFEDLNKLPYLNILEQEQCKKDIKQVLVSNTNKLDYPLIPTTNSKELKDFLDYIEGKNRFKISMPRPKWIPKGTSPEYVREDCLHTSLEKEILNASDLKAQQMVIRSYFNSCSKDLEKMWPGNIAGILGIGNQKYDICEHPNINKFHLSMKPGYVVRGILALKDSIQARPLVIMKCGVYCNIEDSGSQGQLMHFFDAAPFNVILLGNFTGSHFMIDNQKVLMGGFEEGMQVINFVKWLKTTPLQKYISSVHLVGISLGSHSTFYASYLSKFNDVKINSSLALCPVLDYEKSVKSLFNGLSTPLSRRKLLGELNKLGDFFPEAINLFKPNNKLPKGKEIPEMLARISVQFYKKHPDGWQLPPFENVKIQSEEDLWKYNNFLNYSLEANKVPLLAFASRNDWIVPYQHNVLELNKQLTTNKNDASIATVSVDNGNHCASDLAYGWRTINSLYRGYILSRSPSLLSRKSEKNIKLEDMRWFGRSRLQPNEMYIHHAFKAYAKRSYIDVIFRLWSPQRRICRNAKVHNASHLCYRKVKARIKTENLPAHIQRIPSNNVEAREITRWANTTLNILNENNESIIYNKGVPNSLSWTSYE